MKKRNRRGFLADTVALAAGGLAAGAFAASPRNGRQPLTQQEMDAQVERAMLGGRYTCVNTPQQNEGPFYYESSLRRRDITEGRKGVKLKLQVTVANAANPGTNACAPLDGAVVDVWHADAEGMYSNVGGDLQNLDTRGKTFMRGNQVTDRDGRVEFDTVVPGWEIVKTIAPINVIARATHIHLKVFHEHQITTVQLFLPDEMLDQLYSSIDPYRAHGEMTAPGLNRMVKRLRNTEDMVFTADKSRPMSVEKQGDVLVAQATVGIVTMGSMGYKTLFR